MVKIKKELLEEDPSILNRIVLQKAQAEMKKYLHLQEQYWRQEAEVTWYSEGDRNTCFFNNYVNGKRQKLQLNLIQDGNGNWLESRQQISNEAVQFYQNQFTQARDSNNFELLKHIPTMVYPNQNRELCNNLTREEVKRQFVH